jgi:hypothetical protein
MARDKLIEAVTAENKPFGLAITTIYIFQATRPRFRSSAFRQEKCTNYARNITGGVKGPVAVPGWGQAFPVTSLNRLSGLELHSAFFFSLYNFCNGVRDRGNRPRA